MITYIGTTSRTVSGKPIHTISLTGIGAALIEKANNASFYGIKKSFGDCSDTAPGMEAACEAINEYLNREKIDCYGFDILKARTIDTSGTPVPYKAEIDFILDT